MIVKHYNLATFKKVKQMYAKDIDVFGYRDDVDILEKIIRTASGVASSHS